MLLTLTLTLTLTVMMMLAFLPILMFATSVPTHVPTESPTTATPTTDPPTATPTYIPEPTFIPSEAPSITPSAYLTNAPTNAPTEEEEGNCDDVVEWTKDRSMYRIGDVVQWKGKLYEVSKTHGGSNAKKPTNTDFFEYKTDCEEEQAQPSAVPIETTEIPTALPTPVPGSPTLVPTTASPSGFPTAQPTKIPTDIPTEIPTTATPTTATPTTATPTTATPTQIPTTATPTQIPTTATPTTETPTEAPTIRHPDLNTALRNAQPGDIIEFEEFIQPIKTYVHGTAEQPITIRGVGSSAVISGEQKNYFTTCVKVMHDHYIFENFDVRHCDKGIMTFGANHGVLRQIVAQSIAQEAFHLLESSQFWLLDRCTARASSDSSMTYGEGFYLGSARSNWLNALEPDATSYVTVQDCQAEDTNNDGFDVKEGAHHIKFIRCKASWPSGPPRGDPSVGNSGWYIRANDVQLVDCHVQDLQGGFPAVKVHAIPTSQSADVCGAPYGTRGVELKGLAVRDVSGDNRTSSALLYFSNDVADTLVLYTDFDFQRVQGGGVYQPLDEQLRWPVLKDPAEFEMMSWDASLACRQFKEWKKRKKYKRDARIKRGSTVYKSKRNHNRRNKIKRGRYWKRLRRACVELHRPGKRCACVGAWTSEAAFAKGDTVNFKGGLYQAKRRVKGGKRGNPRQATRHWQYLDQCI